MPFNKLIFVGICLSTGVAATARGAEPPELYIVETDVATRFRAVSLDGSSVRDLFASGLGRPMQSITGVDFDPTARRLWWTNTFPPNSILSANLDGSDLQTCYSSPSYFAYCARDAMGRLYFSRTPGTSVTRVNADGSGESSAYWGSTIVQGIGIDPDNGHLYVGTIGPIYRTNMSGGDFKTIVTGSGAASGIALDVESRRIYWIDRTPHTNVLMSANLDGTDWRHLALDGMSGWVRDVVIDRASGQLFFSVTNRIYSCGLNGENLRVIYQAPGFYWIDYMTLSTGRARQPLNDCDDNGVVDDIDIANGAPDCDRNGVPDGCQSAPCEEKEILFDTDWDRPSEGHVVGTAAGWELFQALYVPEGGWSIAEIGIDGFTTRIGQNLGLSISIHPSKPGVLLPDDSVTLATGGPIRLQFSTTTETWQYTPVEIRLSKGVYWLRVRANEPDSSVKLRYGFGAPSRRRTAGGDFELSRAIALRLVRSDRCVLDYDRAGDEGDILDLLAFLDDYSACDQAATPCGAVGNPDYTGDGVVDILDFLLYIDGFSRGCQ